MEEPFIKRVSNPNSMIESGSHRQQNPIDQELEQLLSKQKAKIKVVGTGGAGNNTINRITDVGIKGVESIAINTDAQDLLYTNADSKVLIGRELTQGLGAGSMLIHSCEETAKQHGYTEIGLGVNPTKNSRAKKLYERLGYRDVGTPSYLDGVYDGVEDWVIDMKKEL